MRSVDVGAVTCAGGIPYGPAMRYQAIAMGQRALTQVEHLWQKSFQATR